MNAHCPGDNEGVNGMALVLRRAAEGEAGKVYSLSTAGAAGPGQC